MSITAITKQIAKQALGEQMKDVLGNLRPADAAATAEAASQTAPNQANAPAENVAAVIVGQVQAMQNVLKPEQELVVVCTAGVETLRVVEIFAPSPKVLVLTGFDTEQVITRVIAPVEGLQLVCKPMAVQAGAKPVRVRIITPRPKEG